MEQELYRLLLPVQQAGIRDDVVASSCQARVTNNNNNNSCTSRGAFRDNKRVASAPTQIDVPQMYVRETPVTIHIFFGIMVPRNAGRFLVYGKNYDGWVYSI